MLFNSGDKNRDVLREMLAVSVNGDGPFKAAVPGGLEACLESVALPTVPLIADDNGAKFRQ